jgi:hypothetical protein
MKSQPLFQQEQQTDSFEQFESAMLWNSEMLKVRGGEGNNNTTQEEEEEDTSGTETSEDSEQKDGFN